MNRKIIYLFLVLIIFSFTTIVSANGLTITSNPDFKINKTQGSNIDVVFTLKNEENFAFYNITLEDENNAKITKLNKLDSGQSINVTATITSDESFTRTIRVRGDYQIDIGVSNKTEVVQIDFDDGFDRCNINLVKGDSIKWVNNVLDEIKLRNSDTFDNFATILEGQNHTRKFSDPTVLKYHATRIGLPFTNTCTINVQNDEGYVHNFEYDALLNFEVKVNFLPTTVVINILTTDYTLNYNQKVEDVFSIKNTGSEKAKNIVLSGEWMTFSQNNFDLNVGESKNIGLKIEPFIYETNQTNRTYEKVLRATGNFNDITKDFNIKINHKNLDTVLGNGTIDNELLKNFFLLYCNQNPDDELCLKQVVVINETDGSIVLELSRETFNELIERQARSEDEAQVYQQIQNEIDVNQTSVMQSIKDELFNLKNQVEEVNENSSNISSISLFLFITVSFIIFMGLMIWLIFDENLRKNILAFGNFHKGEQTW